MYSYIRQTSKIFFAIIAYQFLAGCLSHYYLVTSDFVVTDSQETPPEIVESQTYRSLIPSITTLGIKTPEGCANETAAQSSGEAAGQGVLLKTTCGIEMDELERALTKVGFQVISWKTLQNKVLKEKMTPRDASKELGAEVLFQINSLERSLIQTGQDARWERRFFESNQEGKQLNPIALSEEEGNRLVRYIKGKEASLTNRERLSVTMNASASSVRTGETLWFYEWTHAEAQKKKEALNILAMCDNKKCQDPPSLPKPTQKEALFVIGESEAISKIKNAKNHQTAVYHKLLRDLVTNLATSFKHQP